MHSANPCGKHDLGLSEDYSSMGGCGDEVIRCGSVSLDRADLPCLVESVVNRKTFQGEGRNWRESGDGIT